ncbi:MAG: hypothetical protein N3B13_05305 [Deltaproteobacteria bacterium]|nr:hypothetical protein [Deltaproteobacteria bacterium]
MRKKTFKDLKTEKRKISEYMDIELEPKVKSDKSLQTRVEEIEKMIFQDIRNMIEEYETEHKHHTTKEKIIARLKSTNQ